MDDDALLAYIASMNEETQGLEMEPVPSTSKQPTQVESEPSGMLLNELRTEVAEIYQQMRQMCVEIQAMSNAQSVREGLPEEFAASGRGNRTPDELAMVEMDFKLSSLRSVLGDLRGLLRELTADGVSESFTAFLTQGQSQAAESESAEHYLTPESDEVTVEMLQQRNVLVNEVASAHRQLANLQQQLELENGSTTCLNDRMSANETGKKEFVANWQVLEDDEYEFELPRDTLP
ncbi:unnamed protein product [Dicrocoelium dendriticum]|nr:unnamed protein product [Dicrocoelium dendriticum]